MCDKKGTPFFLLRDGVEYKWTFSSTTMPSSAETGNALKRGLGKSTAGGAQQPSSFLLIDNVCVYQIK